VNQSTPATNSPRLGAVIKRPWRPWGRSASLGVGGPSRIPIRGFALISGRPPDTRQPHILAGELAQMMEFCARPNRPMVGTLPRPRSTPATIGCARVMCVIASVLTLTSPNKISQPGWLAGNPEILRRPLIGPGRCGFQITEFTAHETPHAGRGLDAGGPSKAALPGAGVDAAAEERPLRAASSPPGCQPPWHYGRQVSLTAWRGQ